MNLPKDEPHKLRHLPEVSEAHPTLNKCMNDKLCGIPVETVVFLYLKMGVLPNEHQTLWHLTSVKKKSINPKKKVLSLVDGKADAHLTYLLKTKAM